jgi:hypothetical protein
MLHLIAPYAFDHLDLQILQIVFGHWAQCFFVLFPRPVLDETRELVFGLFVTSSDAGM